MSKSANGLVNFNAALTFTVVVESTFPTLFFTVNVYVPMSSSLTLAMVSEH